MSLTPEQRALLDATFPRDHIKTRIASGKTLSYIEGWLAYTEANRIFGAGEWGYECTATKEHQERSEDDTKSGKVWRWHVTHTARCVVTVRGCMPIADYGAGHGIDKDLGTAIESSIKEACTDAAKRCLKSYGNRLGLALYDKEQRHVTDVPTTPALSELGTKLLDAYEAANTPDAVKAAAAAIKAAWKQLTPLDQAAVTASVEQRKKAA